MPTFDNKTGRRYGLLLVLSQTTNSSSNKTRWLCKCDCGNSCIAIGGDLSSGRHTSCGCRKWLSRPKHGATLEGKWAPEYSVWAGIKQRCYNPNNPSYKHYGGRNISMCERWRKSFLCFVEDMGKRPRGWTIERIDNNGNYEPNNCRWIPKELQQRNKRTNHLITRNGVTLCLTEWCEVLGLSKHTVEWRRIKGWPKESWFIPPH